MAYLQVEEWPIDIEASYEMSRLCRGPTATGFTRVQWASEDVGGATYALKAEKALRPPRDMAS